MANKNLIKSGGRDIKEIIRRIWKRDFSGNTGLTIKNSIYELSMVGVSKVGALIFMVILARLLMPELFGLYSLALATILIFVAISNAGLAIVLLNLFLKKLERIIKSKAYAVYFTK